MTIVRFFPVSALLLLCLIFVPQVRAQSFDEALELYQNEQYEEAAEIFSAFDDDRGALFAGKSNLALSNFQQAAEFLSQASESSDTAIRQEAQYTLAIAYYSLRDFHLALPILYNLAETPSPSGVNRYAGRFYNQILGFLSGRQRMELLHQIDSPSIRYDLFRHAADAIPFEEFQELAEELLSLTSNSDTRRRIQAELNSAAEVPADSLHYPQAPDGTVYNIGIILPMFVQDDPDFEIPRNLYFGIVLAADEFNSRHADRKIHLEFKNSFERSDSSAAAMNYLVHQKLVDAVIGPLFSSQAASVASISDENETPLIIPLANPPKRNNQFRHSYQINPTPEIHAQKIARFATDVLGYQTFGIITESGTQGVASARTFRQYVEQNGGAISHFVERDFAASGYDLTGISHMFSGSDTLGTISSQALYAPFTGQASTTMMNLLLNDMEANQNNILILGSEDWKYGNITRFQQQNFDIFYTETGMAEEETPAEEFQQFQEEYETRFGTQPDQFSTLGYDVASFLFASLETAGNPAYLERVLQQEDNIYKGLSIQIDINANRINRHLFVRPLTDKAKQLLGNLGQENNADHSEGENEP